MGRVRTSAAVELVGPGAHHAARCLLWPGPPSVRRSVQGLSPPRCDRAMVLTSHAVRLGLQMVIRALHLS